MKLTGYDHNMIGVNIEIEYFQDMYSDSLESLSVSVSPYWPPDIDGVCLWHSLTVESCISRTSSTGGG